MTDFNTHLLHEAFRRYHAGESMTDDQIVEMLRFMKNIEIEGWVLDSRFVLFVAEIREMCTRLRGFMNTRMIHGNWQPSPTNTTTLHQHQPPNPPSQNYHDTDDAFPKILGRPKFAPKEGLHAHGKPL